MKGVGVIAGGAEGRRRRKERMREDRRGDEGGGCRESVVKGQRHEGDFGSLSSPIQSLFYWTSDFTMYVQKGM